MTTSNRGLVGRVDEFDGAAGLGRIDGLGFHCVSIVGGARHIAVGTPVSYRLVLRLGRPEAVELVELSETAPT